MGNLEGWSGGGRRDARNTLPGIPVMACSINRFFCDVCQLLPTIAQLFARLAAADSGLARQGRLFETYAGQAGGHQRADIAVVVGMRAGQHAAVMLAEATQGFLQAQAFE